MNPFFIIRLPIKQDAPVLWKSSCGEHFGQLNSVTELSILAEKANNIPVAILVPGELVTLHELEISGRLSPAVLQSIPYRLEDELATDVDDLHIAIIHKSTDSVKTVIVENQWMQLWHNWLEEAGINASCWIPDTLALPWHKGQCVAVAMNEQYLLRHGQWDVACCDKEWLELYIEGISKEAALPAVCYGEPQSGLPDQWQFKTVQSPLEPLIINPDFNILQGQWQRRSPWKKQLKQWRLMTGIAAVLVVSWLGNTLLETQQLNQNAQYYQAESRRIYHQLFPGERVVRLQSQLNQKLNMLDKPELSQSGLLHQLNQLAPVFKSNSDLNIQSLQYDQSRGSLRIEAQGQSFDTFSVFREQAGKLVNINVESLEQKEEQVVGVLVIRSTES